MGTPTKQELEQALAEAVRMREQGEDEHHVAKVLLNHDYRLHLLERVLDTAQHFLRSGLAPHEHTELLKAIAAVEHASRIVGSEREDFGLE